MRLLFGVVLVTLMQFNLSAQEIGCIDGDCENGYGVYRTSVDTYYGSFLDGKKHFWGCQDYEKSKQIYCGNYSKGNKHLFGSYFYYDGDNDFSFLAYDRNEKLRSGFYIDASASKGGANSMRRDALKIKPKYTPAKDGTGCVDGDCENGKGVIVHADGDIYSGGFFEGKRNGWGCYQFYNKTAGVIDRFFCGFYARDRSIGTSFNFVTDTDSYSFDGSKLNNTLDFKIGINDVNSGEIKTGIYTADISDEEERRSLQFKFSDSKLGSIEKSGAMDATDLKCLYGNCKNSKDGYSIKSNYNGDWFGYEFSGNYKSNELNGFACQYFPKHPKLEDENEIATSEFLYCGNFINGTPMYFGTTYYGGSSVVDGRFYFGLHEGYSWVPHGVYAYKDGSDGWVLDTATYNE